MRELVPLLPLVFLIGFVSGARFSATVYRAITRDFSHVTVETRGNASLLLLALLLLIVLSAVAAVLLQN